MKIAIAMRKQDGKYGISLPYLEIAKQNNLEWIPVLPNCSYIETLAKQCDGLLLPGGSDIDPALYGKQAEDISYDAEIDALDLALIKAFCKKQKPILGICRGMQMLNVAMQGSLYLDLDCLGYHHTHDAQSSYDHELELLGDSYLSKFMRPCDQVNSYHHQAVDKVGDGLQVIAKAPDGIIEAIAGERMLGVQWHPELLADETSRKIFDFFREEWI